MNIHQLQLGVLLASLFLGRCALAQTQQEWMDCLAGDLRNPDVPIAGCSAVINTGEGILRRLANAYNNRGVARRLKANYAQAIDDFNEAIRLEPNYANAFNNRGVAYRNIGDLDHALSDYDRAILIKPDYFAAFYNRGLALTDRQEYAKAVSDFKVVLAADPRNPLVLYRLGAALVKAGDGDAGNADLAEAKAIKPNIEEEIREGRP
ncbi:tetratricopeptide repeat protein [Bradyrhizobium manausense]|uniref:tetratricopeptide repeat protein n=1 Tax=Bradyrhizobium manausense TaxID=989370 RepID=UPI001BA620F8|nr:tetratricopeptide repeat protein [Bradyrhizobium manausense]MBR1092654.1 tetratricopeptide repeat protein [Bradyrhizobium manausense]